MSEKENELNTKDVQTKPRNQWAYCGILLTLFATCILIAAFVYAYFESTRINQQLVNAFNQIEQENKTKEEAIRQLQTNVESLNQAAQKSEQMAIQLEKINADLQGGNFSKWYLAEAEYLVNLANDTLQFTHQTERALLLLQRAEKVLENIDNPNLLTLRKAIANNITQLQTLSPFDASIIYTRLNALDQQIDQLPLPQIPLNANATIQKPTNANLSFWKNAWQRTKEILQQLVVIQPISNDKLPFVMPNEKIFLYQNIHTQLQIAMWAALNQKPLVYQNALNHAINWIQKYFVLNARATQVTLQNLYDLQKNAVEPTQLNFADTLKLFHDNNQTTDNQTTPNA